MKAEEKLENYGTCKDDNPPEIDIHTILNDYSKEGSDKKITNINKHYTYTKGNFNRDLLDKITSITNKLLNEVNDKYRLRIKLYDIDRIEEISDIHDNKQYIVSLLIHKVNEYATSRLILCYYQNRNNNVFVNYLKSESESLVGKTTKLRSLDSYNHLSNNESFNKTLLKDLPNYSKLGLQRYQPLPVNFNCLVTETKQMFRLQEPCNYNLHEWDTHGVNKQVKLNSKCSIGNNSDVLPTINPYYNPAALAG